MRIESKSWYPSIDARIRGIEEFHTMIRDAEGVTLHTYPSLPLPNKIKIEGNLLIDIYAYFLRAKDSKLSGVDIHKNREERYPRSLEIKSIIKRNEHYLDHATHIIIGQDKELVEMHCSFYTDDKDILDISELKCIPDIKINICVRENKQE